MSFDLAVWEGPTPADDRSAALEFEHRYAAAGRRPPSAAITSFVADLLGRFPEDDPDDDSCPWAAGPLLEEASGDFIYFAMTYSGAERVYDEVVEAVRRHALVCFDPQAGRMPLA